MSSLEAAESWLRLCGGAVVFKGGGIEFRYFLVPGFQSGQRLQVRSGIYREWIPPQWIDFLDLLKVLKLAKQPYGIVEEVIWDEITVRLFELAGQGELHVQPA